MKHIFILITAAFIASCNTSEPVAAPPKDSFYISVKPEMVSKTNLGYVNSGSTLYGWGIIEKGYRVDVKNNDKIISTQFAGDNLSEVIDNLKYQHCQKDSIIPLNKCK